MGALVGSPIQMEIKSYSQNIGNKLFAAECGLFCRYWPSVIEAIFAGWSHKITVNSTNRL
jgi:hypothetical protein